MIQRDSGTPGAPWRRTPDRAGAVDAANAADTDTREKVAYAEAAGSLSGGVDVAAVMAVQGRHALRTLAVVVAGLVVLLGGFAFVPAVGAAGIAGVPFGWLVLTAVVQPLWLVVALRHVRAAEQAERDLVRAAHAGRGRAGRGAA